MLQSRPQGNFPSNFKVNPKEQCNAISLRRCKALEEPAEKSSLPPKMDYETKGKGDSVVRNDLCDLRASVNLMPLSIFQKFKLGEACPTSVSLQMTDRSVKHPCGVIEDVLVKVNKFIFLADFIILDMEEDENISINLGRPFLATGRALIDVDKGELKLHVQQDELACGVVCESSVSR
ncbi:uncharacterized protein LOC133785099 [Humulus lupulus]|uniref:uncharacterized protein LOC133785099 n=1 Tax=Humulus lupulus TaxID=3486 RepID=UPI002B4065C1|nr:uncharacterized protein LOC133785099 [Humulus lupulus]